MGLDFEVPLLLFLLSAALGVWVAYDAPTAWARFWWIVGGLALAVIVAYAPQRTPIPGRVGMSSLRLLLSVLPAVVAPLLLMTNVFQLHPNVIGGVIGAFLPLQVAALWAGRTSPAWIAAGLALVAISSLGLLASDSQGAWLALSVVAAFWLWTRMVSKSRARVRWLALFGAVGSAFVLTLVLALQGEHLLASRPDRLAVWRNSLDLAGDYPFTGLGLSGFAMAYSSYVLLVHVPHTFHSHSLLLDVQLQQGMLGLAAFLWWVLAALRPRSESSPWTAAARASMAVILLHGLLDDVFYGYGGYATLLMFVPLGILAGGPKEAGATIPDVRNLHAHSVRIVVSVALVVGLGLAGWQIPAARAVLEANMGAISQTRTELPVYSWPEWPIQDAVRRSSPEELSEATGWYRASLQIDPSNATANRRLGQIALSLGHYEEARRLLLAAYAADPNQRAVAQLLGEAYAVEGRVAEAAALWRTIDVGEGQLHLRRWWYGEFLRDGQRTEWISQASALIAR